MVAIKGFDEELYRLVKAYASLEGRTIVSVVEEALRYWMRNRGDYDEIRAWVKLEESYKENIKTLKKEVGRSPDRYGSGYALVCNSRLIGVFSSYDEAILKSREVCKEQALIVKLPYREEVEELELGLPW